MKQLIVSFQIDEHTLAKVDDAARSERKNRSEWIRERLLAGIPERHDADSRLVSAAEG